MQIFPKTSQWIFSLFGLNFSSENDSTVFRLSLALTVHTFYFINVIGMLIYLSEDLKTAGKFGGLISN